LWYGELQPEVETNQLTWSGTNQTVLLPNRDGLLLISSSRPVYVRAFQADQVQTNEITPQPIHVLAFTCSPTNSVEFDVEHIGQEPTLFRLDLRRLIPSATNSTESADVVHYDLLTEEGSPMLAQDVTLTNTFSPYDWLVGSNSLADITVPQSLYFALPSTARTLRVKSPHGTVLVNAYSRPGQLAKRIRIPEDYSPAGIMAPEQPSWFTLRPRDYLQRRLSGQAGIVRVQARPPDYDPLVQAGQYEWDSFLPETEARGQMILLPAAEGQPPRPDSQPFSYFPVTVGAKQRVRFQAQSWQAQVEPTLMLVFTNGSPGSATVSVDGQTLLDNRLEAAVTQVRLGTLTAGEHELNISATRPVSAYLNYLEPATNAAYLQRFCTLASSNALSYPYLKRQTNAEVLVLRIFSPRATNPPPFEVRLRLKTAARNGAGPFTGLTFPEREALVTPRAIGCTWLVAASSVQLDDGEFVFFPVGPDLPPGRYDLEVQFAGASRHWLSLSRTTPGLAEKLQLTSQHGID
jgi:hypothetical protein